MRQIELSDALIELAESIILQAICDYEALRSRGVFTDGQVNDHLWVRRRDTGSIQPVITMRSPNDALELLHFFRSWPLDFLCDLTGHKACRIRKKLGLKKEAI